MEGRVRVSGVREGAAFVPFHHGSRDGEQRRAANELTITALDPVSKQPIFKVAAVRLAKPRAADGTPSPAPLIGGPAPVDA